MIDFTVIGVGKGTKKLNDFLGCTKVNDLHAVHRQISTDERQ
jgi:hypothetical protein